MSFAELLGHGLPVLPIVSRDDADAVARALDDFARAGITAAEITLRTPRALSVIERLANHSCVAVGVGTVLNVAQLRDAVRAGARFAVSPGYAQDLVREARRLAVPYLPGVSTSSEIMRAVRAGVRELKLFPAEIAGGAPFLRAMRDVYPDVRFVPTGGVSLANASSYLALDNVAACGGSWLAEGIGERSPRFRTALAATVNDLAPFRSGVPAGTGQGKDATPL